jgi:hypothetical protein
MRKKVEDLKPGDRYESLGFTVEVMGKPMPYDGTGVKVWCRIDAAEGWITFAPEATIELDE